jgi:acetyl-CoA carboxylase carboxyl transferase subunit alpha
LAIGIGDRVLMLENAVYSVITPEGCAAILWKDEAADAESKQGVVARAAQCLRLTASDLLKQGLIDQVIEEPGEGAHVDFDLIAENLGGALSQALGEVKKQGQAQRLKNRYEKLRRLGVWQV